MPVVFGKPPLPVAIEGGPVTVSVTKGGTIPEFDTVSDEEGVATEAFTVDVKVGETRPELGTEPVGLIDPSSLPGMAVPTPELVKGVGSERVAVLGLSAGSSS